MFMMGLSQWVLWSAWYLKQFVFLFIAIFLMALLMVVGVLKCVHEWSPTFCVQHHKVHTPSPPRKLETKIMSNEHMIFLLSNY